MKADPTTPVGRPVGGEPAGRRRKGTVQERGAGTTSSAAKAGGQVRQRGAVLVPRGGLGLPRRGPGRLEISGGLVQTAQLPPREAGSFEEASPGVAPVGGTSRTGAEGVGPTVELRPGQPGKAATAQTPVVGLEARGEGLAADLRLPAVGKGPADGKGPDGLIGKA